MMEEMNKGEATTVRGRYEIEKKYINKEIITEEEFLDVICNFNPIYDSPAVLFCYLQRYRDYINSLNLAD